MDTKNFPHRVPYESDPATPRHRGEEKQLVPQPHWGLGVRFWNKVGLLGMGGKYIELREWFRDNNMRLFHRLHNALEGSVWLGPHEGVRTRKGTFRENGDDIQGEAHAFVIYPGTVEGRVGYEVIIVDALDPGQYEFYISARAVVARCGGKLSHGAILLRELKKPSAIIPECPFLPDGTRIRFSNGRIEKVSF